MIRMKVFKNVELDMDASGATDDDLTDHNKDTKKENIYMSLLRSIIWP